MSDTMQPSGPDTGSVDAVDGGAPPRPAFFDAVHDLPYDRDPVVIGHEPDDAYPDPYEERRAAPLPEVVVEYVEVIDHDADDDEYEDDYVADPRVVETRAMDLIELAVEVTARPDADPEEVAPVRPVIDIALDPPRYADDPVDPPTVDAGDVADPAVDPAVVEVDPRMAERRTSADADRRRRRVRRVLGVFGLVALGAAGYGVIHSPLLDVDRLAIIGSDQLTAADVASRTGVEIGSPLVFVDPGRVQAELREDPRFVRVVVERQFPSSVSIRLTDRRAIAVVVGPTKGVVVGEDGVIISVAKGDELLRHVEVQDDPSTKVGSRLSAPLAAAVDVMGSMSFEIAVQIQKMSITPEGELVFDLGEGRTVLFGTVDDADRKLLAVKTMLGPQIDLRGVCRIDVRVPTAPTMRRNPDCDPPPPPVDPPTVPAVDPATGAPIDPATGAPVVTDPAATATTMPVEPADPTDDGLVDGVPAD